MRPSPQLFIIGTPLDESTPLSTAALEVIAGAQLIIGESRKLTARHCRIGKTPGATAGTPICLLEHATEETWKNVDQELTRLIQDHGENSVAILLSDTGMPILFDPGRQVLERARDLNFRIRTIPSATSWSTAAAVSGFAPPFYIADFLPRDPREREAKLHQLLHLRSHCVIMDTPYRFRQLLEETRRVFGDDRTAFLAWDIARPSEHYLWGDLARIAKQASERRLDKGEFILIIKGSLEEKK